MRDNVRQQNLPPLCLGQYPVFLWLFKDIMEEIREQLAFHDHLVAAVRDWKNQIIDELKSDQNIIFIGVHCRNGRESVSTQFCLLNLSWACMSLDCLHCYAFRRGDYAYHYKTLYRGNLVDHSHFDKAFQVYRLLLRLFRRSFVLIFFIRSRYNNKRNKIVFLALSDDYNWIKVRDDERKQD